MRIRQRLLSLLLAGALLLPALPAAGAALYGTGSAASASGELTAVPPDAPVVSSSVAAARAAMTPGRRRLRTRSRFPSINVSLPHLSSSRGRAGNLLSLLYAKTLEKSRNNLLKFW